MLSGGCEWWALCKTWNGKDWIGLEWNGMEWDGIEICHELLSGSNSCAICT